MSPDAKGNIKGISVPDLPLSMQRCPETGVSIPECSCQTCCRRLAVANWPGLKDECNVCDLQANRVAVCTKPKCPRVVGVTPQLRGH